MADHQNINYRVAIAQVLETEPNRVFLYWKGRVALYALLKAMGVGQGDEVILPAFTCVVVPNAIIYLGAKPIYVDVDPAVMNTSADRILYKITEKTKCILIQNTFGLSYEVQEIVALAKERGIFTIEDCTHGFGGQFEGKPNGSFCDASFFSTQWNKPFSTGVGGFAVLNSNVLLEPLLKVNQELIEPGFLKSFALKLLIAVKKWMITEKSYWFFVRIYRWMSRTGLVLGSSSGAELEKPVMPRAYFMGASPVQSKEGLKAIKQLSGILKRREKNALLFHQFLKEKGKWTYSETVFPNHSFLKMPILVKDRAKFNELAEDQGIQLGDWFNSPIHPIQSDFHLWELNPDDFPTGKNLSEHIVNLNTDTANAPKVFEFLGNNLDQII
jgi:dTDP-4-amino-4,6-dideoxygalactose transaminase